MAPGESTSTPIGHPYIFGNKYLMSVTDGIGQTACSLEHILC